MINLGQPASVPPGKFGLPLIRENIKFVKNPDEYTQRNSKIYGDIYKTHILGNPTIIVKGRKLINYILENENKYFINDFPSSLKKLLGDSLGTQHNDIHKDRRRILSQLFKLKALNDYNNRLEKITEDYFLSWTSKQEVDIYKEIKKYCFDIAGEYLLGIKNLSNSEIFHEYNIWSKGMFSIPINLSFANFGKAFVAKEKIGKYIEILIKEDNLSKNSLLKVLIENNIDKNEILDQTLMMLYAGHGTLASALWTLCHQLELNPNIFKEYKNIAINNLECFEQYTEALIRECLRISPPVGAGFRKVIKDNDAFGYLFPKGWSVIYQIREAELDDRQYQYPLKFEPHRQFNTQDNRILAFGGGARECIGRELAKQEMKVFAKVLALNYEILFHKPEKIKIVTIPTIHPVNNVPVSIHKAI